jgi:hypothetical protein
LKLQKLPTINELLKRTELFECKSLIHQITTKCIGFENHKTPRGAIISNPNKQYVYCLHLLDNPDDPLGKSTGKKVGRCKSIQSRINLYKQQFRNGYPDRCPFTRMLIQCLQGNPDKKIWMVTQFLEWEDSQLVKAKRESYWKKKYLDDGYDLLSK